MLTRLNCDYFAIYRFIVPLLYTCIYTYVIIYIYYYVIRYIMPLLYTCIYTYVIIYTIYVIHQLYLLFSKKHQKREKTVEV